MSLALRKSPDRQIAHESTRIPFQHLWYVKGIAVVDFGRLYPAIGRVGVVEADFSHNSILGSLERAMRADLCHARLA